LYRRGCITTSEFIIDNILTPELIPNIQAEVLTCIGDPIIFSTDLAGTLFQWVGPLGAQDEITELNTSVPSTTIDVNSQAYLSGDWKVIVTDENGCTSISNPISIDINSIPDASILGDETVCETETLKMYTASITGASYLWYEEDPNRVLVDMILFNLNGLGQIILLPTKKILYSTIFLILQMVFIICKLLMQMVAWVWIQI